jgi:hypothetical protein
MPFKTIDHLKDKKWFIVVISFSAISWREQVTFYWDDKSACILYQTNMWTAKYMYIANILKQSFTDRPYRGSNNKLFSY